MLGLMMNQADRDYLESCGDERFEGMKEADLAHAVAIFLFMLCVFGLILLFIKD